MTILKQKVRFYENVLNNIAKNIVKLIIKFQLYILSRLKLGTNPIIACSSFDGNMCFLFRIRDVSLAEMRRM
jgi:hypothetical protein